MRKKLNQAWVSAPVVSPAATWPSQNTVKVVLPSCNEVLHGSLSRAKTEIAAAQPLQRDDFTVQFSPSATIPSVI